MSREILHWPSEKPIDWKNDRLALNTPVMWSKRAQNGKIVHGSLLAILHLNWLNDEAVRVFGVEVEIIQPMNNVGVEASAGTHDFDICWDGYIPGVGWWRMQRFFRARGTWGWYRHPPLFGNHFHGGVIPPIEGSSRADDFAMAGLKVGIFVPGQLVDYFNRAFGLKNQHTPGSDRSWFPKDISKVVFDFDAEIQRQRELHMEYKDWSQASKDALANDIAKRLLDGATVKVRKSKNGEDGMVRVTVRQSLARAGSAPSIVRETEDDIVAAIDNENIGEEETT